jgi:pullulanase
MKQFITILTLFIFCNAMSAQNTAFAKYFPYEGNDLGVTYSKEKTIFKVWSPTAEALKLRLYNSSIGGDAASEHKLSPNGNGTWLVELNGDYNGKFYTFQATIAGKAQKEVPDPQAKAVGANGVRGAIIDMAATNPAGWENDKSPSLKAVNQSIIYELHVRDATIQSNAVNRGKFLGLTEKGLKNSADQSIGLDHISELGITHVHLLPFFDFASIDETSDRPKYNWGYDPLNFNALEGSYATDPYSGSVRIKEFKQLVQTFHQNGLRVVMDVVYNHVNSIEQFPFQHLAPNYFFRQTRDGKFSNASACGNETASERAQIYNRVCKTLGYRIPHRRIPF